MRPVSFFGLAVMLTPWATQAQNLVRNPSFETGDAGWTAMRTDTANMSAVRTNREAHTGKWAAEISIAKPSRYCEWRIDPQPKLEPGKRHIVSAWVKQRDVEGAPPYIQVHSFDAAKKPSRVVYRTGRGGTQDWYEIQAAISVPKDSVQCRIDFGMSGSKGTVWFDDVQVVQLLWPTAGNLAPNPSFELVGADWATAETAERAQRPRWSDRVARTGSHSLCIDGIWRTGYGEWRFRQNPKLEAGKEYDVRVWTKQELVREAPPYIEIYSFDERRTPTKILQRDGLKGTSDWYPIRARFRVPQDSAYCRVAFGLRSSTGKVWFDDVCLAPAEGPELPDTAPRVVPETIHVTAVALPRTVQPGRAFDLTVSLRPQRPLKRKRYRFVFEMSNGDVRLLKDEAIVLSTALTPEAAPPTVKLRVPVSQYCPAGSIPLQIACPDAKLVFAPAARRLQLDVAQTARGREATGHMRLVNGKPVMFIDGEPVPFLVYTKCHGLTRQMARNLGRAGVHIHELNLRWGKYEPEPGVIDLSELSQRAIDTLEGDPDARLVIKYRLDVPYWWCQRFPKECSTTYHGHVSYSQSMASDVWRREAVRFMARTVERIRQYPWSRRVVGYHIGAGKGSEFQMWGSAIDYSPAMQNAWRAWLSARYGANDTGSRALTSNQSALPRPRGSLVARTPQGGRVARQSHATRASLPTPTGAANASPTLIETNAQLRDLHQFLSDVNARSITALAKGLRALIGPNKTIGMYYGYLFEHAERVLREGTLGIQDVVELPEIQYQSAPETYYTRRMGESGAFMSPVDSMILRGKSFLLEADIRTHLWKPDVGYGRTWNAYETTQVLRRELLLALTKGVGVRWMDLADYDRDAFGDPDVLRDLKRMTQVAAAAIHETSMPPEVAIFVDAPGLAWFSHKTCRPFLQQLLSFQRSELQRMGAPYDQYLLKDLHRPDLPDYKVYVFLSPLHLTSKDRDRVREVACRDGKTVVWFYAPGLFGEGGRSVSNITQLTGFRLAERDGGDLAGKLLTESHPIVRAAARESRTFGKAMNVSPLFIPDDPEATILGRSASRAPLLALKQRDGWGSIYAATNILPAALWREIARDAGAHIYTENGEPTYAGNGIVGVHTARAGAQVITLPPDLAHAAVEAPFGQTFSRDGQRVRFDTRAGETVLFTVRAAGRTK